MRGGGLALGGILALALVAGVAAWWLAARDATHDARRGPVLADTPSPPRDVQLPVSGSRTALQATGPVLAAGSPVASSQTPGSGSDAPGAPPSAPSKPTSFTGWLYDERGEPLAAHELQLFDIPKPGAVASNQRPVAVATTQSDGSFRFSGVPPGTRRLHVQGPGEGDQPILRPVGTSSQLAFERDEGSIYLALTDAGTFDATVIVGAHAAFWVTGTIDAEDARAPRTSRSPEDWWIESPEAFVQDEAAPLREEAPAVTALDGWQAPGAGPVIQIRGPRFNRILDDDFLAAALKPTDRRLVVAEGGYLTETRRVEGVNLADVGTIHLSRVAGLRIAAFMDSEAVKPTEITVKETGGDRPDRISRVGPDRWGEARRFWCDRRTGRCEITITAPEGLHGTTTVDVSIPGDTLPLVQVPLERSP